MVQANICRRSIPVRFKERSTDNGNIVIKFCGVLTSNPNTKKRKTNEIKTHQDMQSNKLTFIIRHVRRGNLATKNYSNKQRRLRWIEVA